MVRRGSSCLSYFYTLANDYFTLRVLKQPLGCIFCAQIGGETLYEPSPEGEMPECPEWLEEEAKAEWDRLAVPMFKLGLLKDLDMAAFAVYCQAYARWREAEEFISQHGSIVKTKNGFWQQVPQVTISHANQKIMLQAASEFGLTPSARSRIIAGNAVMNEASEMDMILAGVI